MKRHAIVPWFGRREPRHLQEEAQCAAPAARPEWRPQRSAHSQVSRVRATQTPHSQVSRATRRFSATRRRRASWRRRNTVSSSSHSRASATPLPLDGHPQTRPPLLPQGPPRPLPCTTYTRARRSWRRRPPATVGCRAYTTARRRGAACSERPSQRPPTAPAATGACSGSPSRAREEKPRRWRRRGAL